MKKRFMIVLACLMVATFMFAACSTPAEESSAPAESSSAPAESSEAPAESSEAPAESSEAPAESSEVAQTGDGQLIAYSQKGLNYFAWTVMQEAARAESEARGYTFEASDAQSDAAVQFDQFTNFINKTPAAIFCDPIDSDGLIAATDQAKDAGIPVAIVDTPLTGGEIPVTVAFDNYEAGVLAADAMAKAIEEKNGAKEGVALNLYAAMSSEAWRLRREGMAATFEDVYPDITYEERPTEGVIAQVQDAVLTMLSAGETIDCMHTPSDNPGFGMIAALQMEDQWFPKGEEGHIGIVTIDAEPIAIKMIEEGYYDYTIAQDCYAYSAIAMELLDEYTFKGEEVPLGTYTNDKFYWVSCQIVDSESGPYVMPPPYEIGPDNYSDAKHWANIAENELALGYDYGTAA